MSRGHGECSNMNLDTSPREFASVELINKIDHSLLNSSEEKMSKNLFLTKLEKIAVLVVNSEMSWSVSCNAP